MRSGSSAGGRKAVFDQIAGILFVIVWMINIFGDWKLYENIKCGELPGFVKEFLQIERR